MFSELFSWVEDQSLWRGLDWKLLGSRLDAPDLCVSAGSGWHCALFSVILSLGVWQLAVAVTGASLLRL